MSDFVRLYTVYELFSWKRFPFVAGIYEILTGDNTGLYALTIGETIVGRYKTEKQARKELRRIEMMDDCEDFIWNNRKGKLVRWVEGNSKALLKLEGYKRARRCDVTEIKCA